MKSLRALLFSLRHRRPGRAENPMSEASLRARYRFRHSMLGEPGLDEAMRLFGIGR